MRELPGVGQIRIIQSQESGVVLSIFPYFWHINNGTARRKLRLN